MNRIQKRQRLARINKAKRVSRNQITLTRQDIERTAVIAEGFIATDREFVDEYSAKLKSTKNKFFIFLSCCIILGGTLFLGIDLGILTKLYAILFFVFLVLAVMQCSEYAVYRSRLPFWKRELQENTEFHNGIRSRLQRFNTNHATTVSQIIFLIV